MQGARAATFFNTKGPYNNMFLYCKGPRQQHLIMQGHPQQNVTMQGIPTATKNLTIFGFGRAAAGIGEFL